MKRKLYVLDTSVLLYDMKSIHSFDGNTVVLPVTVLDELDRFKDKPDLKGAAARYVNRFLDDLRAFGKLEKGINISNLADFEIDQDVRIDLSETFPDDYPKTWQRDRGDNMILACALNLKTKNPDTSVKLITKDINLRVKADSLGIEAEDFLADHIDVSKENMYRGVEKIMLSTDEIDELFRTGEISFNDGELYPNECLVTSDIDGRSALAIFDGSGSLRKALDPEKLLKSTLKIKAANKEQVFACNLLLNRDIPLVSINGIAGSGKTFLTLVCAMHMLTEKMYKRIVLTRSVQPVGKDLGYLPGDLMEKMSPWLAPITDNFRHAFGQDMSYFDAMIQRGDIEIAPLSYIRGRTFNDSIVIVDEAQNTTIHELKTIVTRVGKGSKIILLGDTDQIDTPYITSSSNGLSIVIEKMKDSRLTGHITLAKGQRSDIATLAADVL